MKKTLLLLLCAALALTLTACGKAAGPASSSGGASAGMPNPIVDYPSMDEAAKAAGFALNAPETLEGYPDRAVQVIGGKTVQIMFTQGEDRVLIRKAAGSGDISGDYNDYPVTKGVTCGKTEATFKGDADGLASLALWEADGWAYSVACDVPMAEDALAGLVSRIN